MMNPIVFKRIADGSQAASDGLLRRAIRRIRLPLRKAPSIEQTAALNRAQRLFEVNFRSTWTR